MTYRLMRRSAALLVIAAATIAAASAPAAAAAKTCDVGNTRSYGTTYVIEIGVTGVSCATGKRVIRAFQACRPGKSGRCPRVSGYRCSERRFNKSPQSYDSDVTCKRGAKRVTHTYTQFI
jgi:hypothetical protein